MGQEPTITLSIKESGERPNGTYLFHVLLDGKAITSNQSLSLEDSRAVREVSRSFGALFEQGCRPQKDTVAQQALGKQLFDIWLAPSWEKIKAGVPVGSLRFLVIASEAPEILNLPWELLLPPDDEFLGINPLFRIRRLPGSGKQLAPFAGELRPRPLRLLFMACSPTDLTELDYEREEEALMRAIAGQDVAFDSCDLGTFDELKERVNEFKPHVVHLTGHGAVINGQGHFAFEKEDGTADLVPSKELRRFLAGSGVQCVFVSGCQSGKAPVQSLGGICQGLVSAEVPLAVGWAASIADDLATNFARTFYKTVKNAQPVDRALLLARQEAWKACQGVGDPSWALPVLYSATSQSLIFDPDHQRPPEEPTRQNLVLEALPGMKEGHAEHFVGRRREQRFLLPALKNGDLQIVIITGLGGSGKSTLATRLARKLETYGFISIPISSSKENPLNSARLLQAFGDAFRQEARKQRSNASKANGLAALAEDLSNAKIPVESRLRDAVIALNEGSFLLILDNFETNMDEADLYILDSEIAEFYKYLLENLSEGSRAIITTRYPPSDLLVLPPKVQKEDLSDFSKSSFFKILQRDPGVERRIRYGELSLALLSDLHKKFGGTPRFILQIREVVKEMDANVLEMELASVELPAGAQPGELQKLRTKYFGDIFIERLYGYLTLESQKALCRAAVYGVPVTLQGLLAVAGKPFDQVKVYAQNWQKRTFAYQDSDNSLWSVYVLLRPWLQEKLSSEERKNANRLAGKFLVDMEELNQWGELGLTSMDCVMEARSHFLRAEEIELARGLTMRLSDSLMLSGFYEDVRQLNAELLDYEAHPSSMIWIANAYFDQGKYDSACHWYQRSLRLSCNSNLKDIAASLHGLATIDLMRGDYDAAYEKFQKDIAICEQIGDHVGRAKTLHNLAIIELKKSNYDSARENFEKILDICRRNNDRAGEASALYALATIDLGKSDYGAAREKFKKVIEFRQYIGDRHGESSTWHQLATIDMKESDYDSAREKFQKSLQISLQIGDRAGEASTLQSLATIDFYEGKYDSAKDNFERAIKIMRQIGDRAGEASILNNLASIYLNRGEYVLAREKLEDAMKIIQQISDHVGEASILSNLASIDMIKGDRNSAREELEKAIEIAQQIGDRAGEATAFQQLGILAQGEGRGREGMKLVALGWLINSSIHHVDAQDDAKILSIMASELGYTKRMIKAVMKKVAEAYKKDQGEGLIKAAFPKS